MRSRPIRRLLLGFQLQARRHVGCLETPTGRDVQALLTGYSIEVTPKTASEVNNFKEVLPATTRVYLAHIDGTPIDDMVSSAARLHGNGYKVMPHIPARLIKDTATLENWLNRYQYEAGVDEALLIAGDCKPCGRFDSSIQLLETGLFDQKGFQRLHFAGHPEGNRDIGSFQKLTGAILSKQHFCERTNIQDVALVTQFCFDYRPVIDWATTLRAEGVDIPIHVGVAGPTKLKMLIKHAMACGVGASLRVLQKRAMDMTQLLLPYEPIDLIADLAKIKAENPSLIQQIHLFPFGGVYSTAEWANSHGGHRRKQTHQRKALQHEEK
jgi:methylenetetrahydrofolate reductase (NADPH)